MRQQEAQAFNARDAAQIQKRSENDLLKHVIANALAEREKGEGAEVAAVQHEAERMRRSQVMQQVLADLLLQSKLLQRVLVGRQWWCPLTALGFAQSL